MSTNDPLAQLLGNILGGVAQQPGDAPTQGDALGGLLGALMSGAAQPPGNAPQQDGQMGDLLGSLLGGATQQQGSASQQGGQMSDLLGSFLGGAPQQSGNAPQQGGPMGDLLGALVGGGGASAIAANPTIAPIVDALAKKLGLPADSAQMVIGFVMNTLLAGFMSNAARNQQGVPAPTQDAAFDLNDLVQRMSSGKGLDKRYLKSTGLVEQLAGQSGLDAETATKSLQQVFKMLGSQMGG